MARAHNMSSHHAEWMALLEPTGPFLSIPVLQATFPQGLDDVQTEVRATLVSVVTCCPGLSKADFEPCATCTAPSTTLTREPLVPRSTAKMVPFTETVQSAVMTSNVPFRCLAA